MTRCRLGIDTGGTYTDAVLIDGEGAVLASAKSVTTRHDLALGIAKAVAEVLDRYPCEIDLVGLSTTLATNAIVENRGGRAGLIMIGFTGNALSRGGLPQVLSTTPHALIRGGHDAHGVEREPLGKQELQAAVTAMSGDVEAFAITSAFAVRNPRHELEAAQIVRDAAGKPVTLSHELTAKLDGPKRALTTLLNAQLVPQIDRLLRAVEEIVKKRGISAPVMVVRGDGSLMRAEFVRPRPVETILSGPAASVVGAAKLAGLDHALISDVGGTTTDIALLQHGRPKLDPMGARVGDIRTMVEAIELRTSGLGGDSRVKTKADGSITLGPERSIPLSLLAQDHPDVLASLEAQLERERPRELDGQFAKLIAEPPWKLSKSQNALIELLRAGPQTLEQVIERAHLEIPLKRFVREGWVAIAGMTPSDAAHVLDLQATWNLQAANLGAALEARKLASGTAGTREIALSILQAAKFATAKALAEAASAADGETSMAWLNSDLAQRALEPQGSTTPVLAAALTLDRPVIAVGGPAAIFYPDAVKRLNTQLCLPDHFDVANAVGAVSGDVVRRQSVTVTQTAEERYVWQLGNVRKEGSDALSMAQDAEHCLRQALISAFDQAGGGDADIECLHEVKRAAIDLDREMIVEVQIHGTVRGRPRIAS